MSLKLWDVAPKFEGLKPLQLAIWGALILYHLPLKIEQPERVCTKMMRVLLLALPVMVFWGMDKGQQQPI